MPSFRVLIAGGGIGGLCLAQGLRKSGIECTLFEAAGGIAPSGYRLHMNSAGGRALQECLPENLYELYLRTSRTTPRREVFVQLDHRGNELGARPHIGPPNDPVRPHTAVNRRTLRQIMAAGLEGVIHFGRTVTGFEQDGDRVRVHLADGSSATGDILVAADGINSVIRRRLLPKVPVVDTHILGMYATAPLTDDLAATLPEALFDGFAAASGPDGALIVYGVYQPRRPIAEAAAELAPGAQIDPVDPYIMVNLGIIPGSPFSREAPDLWKASAEERHEVMRQAVRGWDPALAEAVARIDASTLFPVAVRHLEPADPWTTSRVTLLGDAIHAMPPTFGAGANNALRDAAALTRALTEVVHGDVPLLKAVAEYEAEMRAEVFPILRASADPRAFDSDFLPDELTVPDRD
ncbi:FAD-dependent monooxygenase [Streptomyces sp. D2-8]|uniref:FAD-dependent oxidoreductase n=1 Tax=Streptomyces sp. D2-8 TaxID=2707767 RepID=UPI0020BFC655|nr:NAD(P)/FAD-dependent oxidoreductase [Streptomyces sp. D2-8]MCK8435513.1 FAD-dependent monooxygenase [Streptomyces sp. D2-8]